MYLQTYGSITPQDAYELFQSMRLGALIHDLRHNEPYYNITSKLEGYDEDIKYLRDKLDNLKTPKVKSYDKDVANLNNEIKDLKREIKKLEKLLKDPLADFK